MLQMNCLYFALTASPQKNFLPSTKCHAMLYQMIKSRTVTVVMSGVVFVNCIILALQVGGLHASHTSQNVPALNASLFSFC